MIFALICWGMGYKHRKNCKGLCSKKTTKEHFCQRLPNTWASALFIWKDETILWLWLPEGGGGGFEVLLQPLPNPAFPWPRTLVSETMHFSCKTLNCISLDQLQKNVLVSSGYRMMFIWCGWHISLPLPSFPWKTLKTSKTLDIIFTCDTLDPLVDDHNEANNVFSPP